MSREQLRAASLDPRVEYRLTSEDASGLDAGTVDLVTVAQALHWFDLTRFYAEVGRVLKPGGLLAVWCYGRARIDDPVDADVARARRADADDPLLELERLLDPVWRDASEERLVTWPVALRAGRRRAQLP